LRLLHSEQTNEFNSSRRSFDFKRINFENVNLTNTYLTGTNLTGARNLSITLEKAKLKGAIIKAKDI